MPNERPWHGSHRPVLASPYRACRRPACGNKAPVFQPCGPNRRWSSICSRRRRDASSAKWARSRSLRSTWRAGLSGWSRRHDVLATLGCRNETRRGGQETSRSTGGTLWITHRIVHHALAGIKLDDTTVIQQALELLPPALHARFHPGDRKPQALRSLLVRQALPAPRA